MSRRTAAACLAGALLATGGGTAGAQEAPRPSEVGVIGDSLAVRSEYHLRAVFREHRPLTVLAITDGAYVDWVRRRWVDTILRDPPDTLVVALGHGDGTHSTPPEEFRREVRGFLDRVLSRVRCVRWLDVRERWTRYRNVNRRAAAYNRVLRQEAARRPRRVEVVPYSAWAQQADDSYFEDDRLHPGPTGRRVYARMARQAADGCDPTLRTGPYWDVLDHEAHAPAVRWLVRNRIVRGDHGNGTFQAVLGNIPQALARRDLALWLWRREGRPAAAPPTSRDVPAAIRAAVGWAQELGLVAALPDGRFRPDRPVSRGELIRALWLVADSPTDHDPAPWTDVPTRLAPAAAWAWATGTVDGLDADSFGPRQAATRAVGAMAIAPQDLPPPAPRPGRSGPYPPPLRLYGDPPSGNWFRP